MWRNVPYLHMKGSDEVFITKVTVVLGQCPVPYCSENGGDHQTLPRACLDWWREEGSKILGWRGINGSTTAKAIKQKISQQKKNHKLRRNRNECQTLTQQQPQNSERANPTDRAYDDTNQREGEYQPLRPCEWCQTEMPLSSHLKDAESCLRNYRSKYLPYQSGLYVQNARLAIFDLGLVRDFCINPSCTTKWEDLSHHLHGPCIDFYQREGAVIFSTWGENDSVSDTYVKLKNRRYRVKALFDAHQGRVQIYTNRMDKMLRIVCRNCGLQGPFLDKADHKMVCIGTEPIENGLPVWECGECQSTQRKDIQVQAAKLLEVGSPGQINDTMKPVRVESSNGGSRVVYIPTSMVPDQPSVSMILPQSTTILVPKNPDGLDDIGDEAFDRTDKIKSQLKSLTSFLAKRPSPTSLDITLSVLYQKKLLDIREERLKLMNSMSSSKGEITSRNPNEASILDRKAHYDATQQLCLSSTCSWSEGGQQRMMEESLARSNINGQVKTKVSLLLTKSAAVDNPHLVKVIEGTFAVNGVRPILSLAPIVLQHIQGKVELLRKHVLSSIYNNWDLEVEFLRDEWTVVLKGFLYSEEYESLNKKIARLGTTAGDLLDTIIENPHIFPTVSLDFQRIADLYGMSTERAQVNMHSIIYHLIFFYLLMQFKTISCFHFFRPLWHLLKSTRWMVLHNPFH